MAAAVHILDYPVRPRPRWGHGRAANDLLVQAIKRNRPTYVEHLRRFESFKGLLHTIPRIVAPDDLLSPHWGNNWFSCLDAAALVCFLGINRPMRYVEIGSGNSTKFARFAVKSLHLPTKITSVDPTPRAEIDILCDDVVRKPLEDCDLSIFNALEPGDILFFDGSHRIFTNSDVAVFFFELLPRLADGVLVHVHDIFLPDDYPEAWNDFYFSEQYMLASMLIARDSYITPQMPNYFVYKDAGLSKLLDCVFEADDNRIEKTYVNTGNTPGLSFWFTTSFDRP